MVKIPCWFSRTPAKANGVESESTRLPYIACAPLHRQRRELCHFSGNERSILLLKNFRIPLPVSRWQRGTSPTFVFTNLNATTHLHVATQKQREMLKIDSIFSKCWWDKCNGTWMHSSFIKTCFGATRNAWPFVTFTISLRSWFRFGLCVEWKMHEYVRVTAFRATHAHTTITLGLGFGIAGASAHAKSRWNVFSLIMRIFASFQINMAMQPSSPNTEWVCLRFGGANVCYRWRWWRQPHTLNTHLNERIYLIPSIFLPRLGSHSFISSAADVEWHTVGTLIACKRKVRKIEHSWSACGWPVPVLGERTGCLVWSDELTVALKKKKNGDLNSERDERNCLTGGLRHKTVVKFVVKWVVPRVPVLLICHISLHPNRVCVCVWVNHLHTRKYERWRTHLEQIKVPLKMTLHCDSDGAGWLCVSLFQRIHIKTHISHFICCCTSAPLCCYTEWTSSISTWACQRAGWRWRTFQTSFLSEGKRHNDSRHYNFHSILWTDFFHFRSMLHNSIVPPPLSSCWYRPHITSKCQDQAV